MFVSTSREQNVRASLPSEIEFMYVFGCSLQVKDTELMFLVPCLHLPHLQDNDCSSVSCLDPPT